MIRNFILMLAAACLLATANPVRAQIALPYVPPELHQEQRWLQGSKVTFCLWKVSPTMEIDRRIAQAIGDTLLLDVDFYVYENATPLLAEQFWEEVFIQLAEKCDAVAGFVLASELDADWLTPTRPYYHGPYVFAVTDPDIDRLGDVAPGGKVGSVIFTPADTNLISYMELQPKEQRWVRYPFTSGEQGLDFLLDGRVEGTIFWAPTLNKLLSELPKDPGIRLVPLDPVAQTTTPIGLMLREHNIYLRNELDKAIASLIEDGVIDDILEEMGQSGSGGGAG